MATTELKCDKHGTPTQLTCAQCGKPSCTKCLVWTEVGQKCRTCVPNRGGSSRNSIMVPALVIGVLLVVLLAALGVFSPSSKSSSGPRVPRPRAPLPRIGQEASDGTLTFVVTRFDCAAKEIGDGPAKKIALGRYCLLQFKAKNTGARPTAFVGPLQFLLDAQKRQFAPDSSATSLYQRTQAPASVVGPVQQMNPGAEVETSLIYDVPEGITPEMVELHAGSTLGVRVLLTESANRED